MNHLWFTLMMCASLIGAGRADCLLDEDKTMPVPEKTFVCEPRKSGSSDAEETFGSRFMFCSNSQLQLFECEKGLKFDVVLEDCMPGPPRCSKKPPLAPSPESQPTSGTSTLAQTTTSTSGTSTLAQTTTSTSGTSTLAQTTTSAPLTENAPTTVQSTTRPSSSSQKQTTRPEVTTESMTSSLSSNPQPSTTECTLKNCLLPNCSCLGATPQIDIKEAPMAVMLAFDDAVTKSFMDAYYQGLLVDNKFVLLNPNKCPIRATFFVSADNTDYNVVKTLSAKGHEFASHTVRHILPEGGTEDSYKDEIVGMRDLLVNKSSLDPKRVVGFKAPYLKLDSKMFQVLQDNGFLFDASISNQERRKGVSHLRPFTLDYLIPDSMCPNGPCPKKKYPGLWEVPLNIFQTGEDGYCAMIDGCVVANGTDNETVVREKYLQYFRTNFYEHFYPDKPKGERKSATME